MSQVRRSFSKRSCETAIFTLPLLRLNSPPVETRTAGSLSDAALHCVVLLLSIELELLPSEPVAEPAPEEPLADPRLPDDPVDPVVEPEVVGGGEEVSVEAERFATERSEAARSDCERVAALRVPAVSGVVADALPVVLP